MDKKNIIKKKLFKNDQLSYQQRLISLKLINVGHQWLKKTYKN